MRRRILFVLALAIVATAIVPAQSQGATTERMIFIRDLELFTADVWGGDQRQVTFRSANDPLAYNASLSPDGNKVAFSEHASVGNVWVLDLNTMAKTKVYSSSTAPGQKPKWSHDGTKLIFQTGNTSGADIQVMNANGTGLTKVIGWKDGQVDPDFSPNSSKIVFSSISDSRGRRLLNSENQLFTANPDGTGFTQITQPGGAHRGAFAPDWGPTGEIAFVGLVPFSNAQQGDIFKINSNGSSQQQLTSQNTWRDWGPSWAPDGQTIAFGTDREGPAGYYDVYWVRARGGVASPMISLGLPQTADLPSYRQSDGLMDRHAYAAQEHRPLIHFDEDEHWRPLDIASFFDEGTHQVCRPDGSGGRDCLPFLTADALRLFPEDNSYLDLASINEETAVSPRPGCTGGATGILKDCDSEYSSIYYHVAGPSPKPNMTDPDLGYWYIDYWWFYRYNDSDPDGDHEGDWEGMAVAPSTAQPNTFEFASYAQHDHWYSYLRGNLACDGGPKGSCGGDGSKTGRRPMAYPAEGTHATYPDTCTGSFCTHTDSSILHPESDHGGEYPWGNNNAPAALQELPAARPVGQPWSTATGQWTDWPGEWGMDGGSPQSPGGQFRFYQPWLAECGNGPCESELPKAQARIAPNAKAAADRARSVVDCGGWFGSNVVALACDVGGLRPALAKKRLHRRGEFALDIAGRTSDTAPGIAQAAGRPLRPGERVVVRGRGTDRTRLLIRVRSGKRVYDVEFPSVKLGKRSGRAVVRVGSVRKASTGAPSVRLIQPDGTNTAPSSVTLSG